MAKQQNKRTPGERKRLYVYLTKEDKNKLQLIATKRVKSVSALVNDLILNELEKEIVLDLDFKKGVK